GLTTAGTQVDVFYNALQVGITAPNSVTADTTLSYTITVQNLSQVAITPVQMRGRLTVQATVLPPEISLDLPTVGPGPQPIPMTHVVPPEVSGTLTIAVTALGVRADGNLVAASTSTTVQVQPPTPPIP